MLAPSWCLVHLSTFLSLTMTSFWFLPSLCSWLSLSACSYLGEALRALLVLEMRSLTVHNQQATERVPAHLPQGCTAVRCNVRSASGGHATVVLGGPPDGELRSLEANFAIYYPHTPLLSECPLAGCFLAALWAQTCCSCPQGATRQQETSGAATWSAACAPSLAPVCALCSVQG